MKALLLALIACGDTYRPHLSRPRDRGAIRTDHALLAVDPGVTRALVLVRAGVGALDGEAAFAVARALDTIELKDGWSRVDVWPRSTDLLIEVPSDELGDAIDADARRFAALAAVSLGGEDTRERAVARVAASRALSVAQVIARYATLQVVVVGNVDRAATERRIAEAFGDRARSGLKPRPRAHARGGEGHDRERDRVSVAYDVPEDAVAEVAAQLLVARLPEARVDPPFTVELRGASADAVTAAIAALAGAPVSAEELARAAAEVQLSHLLALEGLAYRARMLADDAPAWSPGALAPEQVRAWFAQLGAPAIVVGDAP